MYHGPREQVVPFFETLGFKLPPRKGTADFLQEITSKKDQAVRSGILPGAIVLITIAFHLCLIHASGVFNKALGILLGSLLPGLRFCSRRPAEVV